MIDLARRAAIAFAKPASSPAPAPAQRYGHPRLAKRFEHQEMPYDAFFPRPHTARPGLAPVCSPSASTCAPLTNTCSHAGRILMRLGVGGVVLDLGRVEHDDVGKVARLQQAPLRQPQVRGRQAGQLADGLFQRNDLLVAHVLAQQAGEVAIGARMRLRQQKRPLGRRRRASEPKLTQGSAMFRFTSASSIMK